ncbi:MAG: hypothetical protein K2I79_01990, partial [Clostridia bacterium]|nr:hypothetical protein [Clostridia bacterium]
MNYSIAPAAGTYVPYIEIYKRTLEVEFISDSVMNITYGDARPAVDEVKSSIDGNWRFAAGSTVGSDVPVIHFNVEQLENIYAQGSTVGVYSREYVIRGTLDSEWSNYQLSEIYEVVDISVAQRRIVVDAGAFAAYIESESADNKTAVVNGAVAFERSYSGRAYSGIVLEYAGREAISGSGVLTIDSALFKSIMRPIPVATNSITAVGVTSATFNVQLADTVNYVMDASNTVTSITATVSVVPAKVEVKLKDDVDKSVYDEALRRVTLEYARVEFLFENYFYLYDTDNDVIVDKGSRNSVWGVNYGGSVPTNPATYNGITVVMNSANYVVTADGQAEDFVMSLVITKNTSDVIYSSWFDGVLIGGNNVYSKNYDSHSVRAADFNFAVQYGEYGNAPKGDLVVEITDAATGNPVSEIKDVGRYVVRFSIAPTSYYCLSLDESKNFIEYRYNVTRYNLTNVDTVR